VFLHSGRFAKEVFWVGDAWTFRVVVASMSALPIIYSLLIPFVILDGWVQLYQAVAFRLCGMEPIRRRDYIVLDRHRLPYLNPLQKVNCAYCGYVTGLIAFVREIGVRTEQFWCPIRHRTRPRGQHRRHRRFAPYGDAAAFHRALPALRRELGRKGSPQGATR
jgi:hypothetical protein